MSFIATKEPRCYACKKIIAIGDSAEMDHGHVFHAHCYESLDGYDGRTDLDDWDEPTD